MTEKKVMRGVKIKLSPSPEQAKVMDQWRHAARKLWNLLLGLEQAAYDGSKFKPELRWRDIWRQVVIYDYEEAVRVWNHGKITKKGIVKKKPHEGPEPVKYTDEYLEKIGGGLSGGSPPGLFIWESDLNKIMARLKEKDGTRWISVLPSHSGQQVVGDIVKAIKTMLSERKKREAGRGRNTGFPKFKRNRYADGSVYMVNTHTSFDHKERVLWLPKMKEAIGFRQESIPDGKLMGGRLWRQGEQWWLSCQFEIDQPKPKPKTGRECGLKIAASVLTTTWDGETIERGPSPQRDAKLDRRIKLANRRLARRKKGTADYYETANELARLHAKQRNRTDDMLHKESRRIVRNFDVITVHKTEVHKLMLKNRTDSEGEAVKTPRSLIKKNRVAAMAKFKTFVSYKQKDEGGVINETHSNFPEVQKCSRCGKLHAMPLDKRIMTCDCGNVMERRANAAVNEFEQGKIVKSAT